MWKYSATLLIAVFASLAFGQTTANSVTVTASRNANVQPDQVVFGVFVDASVTTSRDDVIAALQGSGITLANFTGVSTLPQYAVPNQTPQTVLEWAFGLPVALSDMKSTVTKLTMLQQSVAKANSGMTLSFSVQGTQVSPQVAQSQTCSLPDLVSDARAQAQKIASAAGMALGAILAMSSLTSSAAPGSISVLVNRYTVSTGSSLPACMLTVKFALGAF
jgi:uncharacterized protein YggE